MLCQQYGKRAKKFSDPHVLNKILQYIQKKKAIKKKIEKLTSDMKLSQVINSSIREIQAAIMIAITTAVVVTTVTTNS